MTTAAAEIQINGSVQGVGYRYFCFQKATQLHLTGWVKNNPDRSVSLFVEGEKKEIENLLTILEEGPPAAVVAVVTINWVSCSNRFKKFEITY